ncbi:MAG: hypothetical protein EG824_03945 [Deltaproteobacteria bacterium]|nr:hypothetical protein [Deltaproteobacteria bacterium]
MNRCMRSRESGQHCRIVAVQAKGEFVSNTGNHFDPQVAKVFESHFPTLDSVEPALAVGFHG